MSLFKKNYKEDSFVLQLKVQANKTMDCVCFLQKHMESVTDNAVKENEALMEEMIDIKMLLLDNLQNTFITPFDREDIYHISISLFGIAKYARTTLEEMKLLNVKSDVYIREMIDVVRMETLEITKAITTLMKNPRIAYEHLVNVTKLESKIEKIYREAVKVLLGNKDQLCAELQHILSVREVYRHISNMSDKAEAAADVLGIVVMKLS